MNLEGRVGKLKAKKMKAIEDAIKQNDTVSIVAHTKELERIMKIETQIDEVCKMLDHLECEVNEAESIPREAGVSAKAQGKIARLSFIDEIKNRGLKAQLKKGQLYEIQGNLVGIAYASERAPNKWFLGLPTQDYYAIVLLCKDDTGRTTKLILPREFYTQHHNEFSKGEYKDQIKFNIMGYNGRYKIKFPRKDSIDITKYRDKYEYLN